MSRHCVLVSTGTAAEGRTGVTYAPGVSASTAGATGLCLQIASLPPGACSHVHLHAEHEAAAYVIAGELTLWSGDDLEHEAIAHPGDFLFIPPGVPHVVRNASDREPAVTVLARTDPHEQEDMTALPALEARARELMDT